MSRGGKRRRRRRGRRRGRRDDAETIADGENGSAAPENTDDEDGDAHQANGEPDEKESNRRRRRGRRGGRRRHRHSEDNLETAGSGVEAEATDRVLDSDKPALSTDSEYPEAPASSISDNNELEEVSINKGISKGGEHRSRSNRKPIGDDLSNDQSVDGEASAELSTTAEAPKPRRRRRKTTNTQDATETEKPKPRRRTSKTKAAPHHGAETPEDGIYMPDAKANNANGAHPTIIINVDEKRADNTNPRRGWWKKP